MFYRAMNDEIFDTIDRALGPTTQPMGEFAPPPPEGGTWCWIVQCLCGASSPC